MVNQLFDKQTIIMGLLGILIIVSALNLTESMKQKETILEQNQCISQPQIYTEEVKGCDKIPNCGCLHRNLFGFGTCDTCQCVRYIVDC